MRTHTSAADYFGVQYVYKAGYSTEGFPKIVQKIWPATTKASLLVCSLRHRSDCNIYRRKPPSSCQSGMEKLFQLQSFRSLASAFAVGNHRNQSRFQSKQAR